jgi:hypothetical protein
MKIMIKKQNKKRNNKTISKIKDKYSCEINKFYIVLFCYLTQNSININFITWNLKTNNTIN